MGNGRPGQESKFLGSKFLFDVRLAQAMLGGMDALGRENEIREWLALDRIAVRFGSRLAFRRASWLWRPGEQWAILGGDDSGKSLLAQALAGQVPVVEGEIRCHFPRSEKSGCPPGPDAWESSVALVSPQTQRDFALHESSFYQSRWHSGLDEGRKTVADYLAWRSVLGINPFEVGAANRAPPGFAPRRDRLLEWLAIRHLWRRKLIFLSNGEQRRVLLAQALLRDPALLILDDPYGGLDAEARIRLAEAIQLLMADGLPVLVVAGRPAEIPPATTHLLLVGRRRLVAQGAKSAVLDHPLATRLAAQAGLPAPSRIQRGKSNGSQASPPILVEFNQVSIRAGSKLLLEPFCWTMRRSEHWLLLGPNGSGKTTLLNLVQGDHPQVHAQDIRIFGAPIATTQTLWRNRQRMGWLSPELHQHYPPAWSALEVVCSGFHNTLGLYLPCSAHRQALARRWLRWLGLAHLAGEPFGALPHGRQRLVLLARAAINQPRLLILVEPCQGLDSPLAAVVLDFVDGVVAQTGASVIFATHSPREIPRCITHVLRLQSGRIQAHSLAVFSTLDGGGPTGNPPLAGE